VVEGDLAQLLDVDLHGHALAARSTPLPIADLWRTAGDDLPAKQGFDLRRTMAARHPFDVTAFDPAVVVVDLERLRADRFVEDLVPRLAGLYGLSPSDVLQAYAGADRAELPAEANVRAGVEPVVDPLVVSYAHVGHPAEPVLVPERERWQAYADRVPADGDA
jgi:hypothetical protein